MMIYRTPGPWGAGTDHDLTAPEIDGNFYDLDQRVKTLVDNPPEAISIDSVTMNAQGQLVVTLTDGHVDIFTLPIFIPDYRGEWLGATHYDQGDQVTVTGQGTFMVLQTHDSVAPFDPDRLIGGQPVYALTAPPGATGPAGAAGINGAAGPAGPAGADGIFKIDASGTFAQRDLYDAQPEGFTYYSSNGDAGATTTSAVLFIMGSGGVADWTGPFKFEGTGPQGPAGATGATGPAGANGTNGTNFNPDAEGPYSERATYDAQPKGYSFLSLNGSAGGNTPAVLYFKLSNTSGDWGPPTPFQGQQGVQGPQGPIGPAGPTGATGPAGKDGANFNVNATGTFAGRAAYNAQPEGFRYLSTNGDGSGNSVTGAASIYIRETTTAGVWSTRIAFQGPKGATGPQGSTGTPGTAGPPGAPGVGVPLGGTTGQVLSKVSGGNYDTAWTAPGGASYPVETLMFALSDETTALTTGNAKLTMRMPYKGVISGLPRIALSTASSSGLPTVDINKNGATILSTKLTIDATEKTSVTAAAQAVVSSNSFNDDDEFTYDIDVAGTGAKGLKVTLRIQQVP